MKRSWLYMCKLSGLQRYILASNRLREVIGGSQLLADITDEHLDAALDRLAAGEPEILQRAAGSARIRFDRADDAREFYRVWPVIVDRLAPGLEFNQWCAPLSSFPRASSPLYAALREGAEELTNRRKRRDPSLPELVPAAERAPRTGGPAVAFSHGQLIDTASVRKLTVVEDNEGASKGLEAADVFEDRLAEPDCEVAPDGVGWAVDSEHIAPGEGNYLAVVHADGNRLGKFFIALSEAVEESGMSDDEVARCYRGISQGLDDATYRAANEAIAEGFDVDPDDWPRNEDGEPRVPIRPVVIDGDDVTFLFPADAAVEITATFLEKFRAYTGEMLEVVAAEHPRLSNFLGPDGDYVQFTACAGILFQRTKQPLLSGYDISEKLCAWAKKMSRTETGTASSLMFDQVLDHANEDFDHRHNEDFVCQRTEQLLTAGPYTLDDRDGWLPIDELKRASALVGASSKNSVRKIIDLLETDVARAQGAFKRMVFMGGEHDGKGKSPEEKLAELLEERFGNVKDGLRLIPDAVLLSSAGGAEEESE